MQYKVKKYQCMRNLFYKETDISNIWSMESLDAEFVLVLKVMEMQQNQ